MEKVTLEQLEAVNAKFWEAGKSEGVYLEAKEVFEKAHEEYQAALRSCVEAAYIALTAARMLSSNAEELSNNNDEYVANGRVERAKKVWKYLGMMDKEGMEIFRNDG